MITGDYEVKIGHDTAIWCFKAMKAQAEAGEYKMLFADDASFCMQALKDIERASNEKRPQSTQAEADS